MIEEINNDARILTVHMVPILKPRRSSNMIRLCMEYNASERAVSRVLERIKTPIFEADVNSLVTSTLRQINGTSTQSFQQPVQDNLSSSPKPRKSKIADIPMSSMSYLPDRKVTPISDYKSPNEAHACNWLDFEFPTPDQLSMMKPKTSKRHKYNRTRAPFRALGLSQSGHETESASSISHPS